MCRACVSVCRCVRVVDIEEPVETHVDAERHVHQVLVLLLQVVVDGCETVDDLGDAKLSRVDVQFVLLEHGLSDGQVQQVH